MKTVLTILMLLICNVVTPHDYYNPPSVNTEMSNLSTIDYIPWRCELGGNWGSFWWKVTRHYENGIYYYDVYVSSNSYFNQRNNDGTYRKAITKLSNCVAYMYYNGGSVNINIGTIVFDWEQTYVGHFYTSDPYPKITMRYMEVHPYHYSKYK